MTLSFFWLAVAGGALAIVTPCVFPLIPVTVSYFAGGKGTRLEAVRAALIFSAGIVISFTVLGLGLAATVGAAGLSRFASNPLVNIVLGILFVAFALSLLGAYNITIPHRVLGWIHSLGDRFDNHGVLGPLVFGVAFTIASFTCTAPFVGTLLVLAARGTWGQPIVGMLVFSIVFALPFFILASVPALMTRIPKSGPWISTTKKIVGLLVLAIAIKFFTNADSVLGINRISREVVIAFWIALSIAAMALIILGERNGSVSKERVVALVAPLAIIVVLAFGLRGWRLGDLEIYLPTSREAPGNGQPMWILNDYNRALEVSRQTGKPIFLDFTGYTCTNCRWMESHIFSRDDVQHEFRKFVLARLFTDGDGPIYETQLGFQEKQFGTVALPLYAIVDAMGATKATHVGITRDPVEFIAFLQKAVNPR